jgi:general secretion pathway protein G
MKENALYSRYPSMSSKRRRNARALSRGVTLIEIMIVLTIIAIVGGAVAFGVFPKLAEAKVKATHNDLVLLHTAAEDYRSNHAGEDCPTVKLLKDKKTLDGTARNLDGWDHAYVIECDTDEVYIRSWGADGKPNTADDLVVPEKKNGE